jgi:PilZ domain
MVRLGFGIRGALKTAREDKRRAPRRGYNVTAWIRQEDRFGVHECRVLDLSRSGVRLALVDAYRVPESFVLFLVKNGRGQQARVKWRRGTLIGAGFCAP